MTAAEILRSAAPPPDDQLIEKAIAELDVKIWEWTDALKSAQAQLRSAFAVRPVPAPRASTTPMFDEPSAPSLSAAAAAAHIPSPPPMPKLWSEQPAASEIPAWNAKDGAEMPALGGHTDPFAAKPSASTPAVSEDWAQRTAQQHGGHGASSSGSSQNDQQPGAMAWPTSGGASTMNWPESSTSSSGPQAWPTWTPTDGSTKKSGVRSSKAPKAVRQPLPQGPSPEERAQKAAAEEALLSELEDAIARRVRLLRRLDPDTPIEKLIEKARQGHAEASTAAPPRDDKSSSSSSWWRRK